MNAVNEITAMITLYLFQKKKKLIAGILLLNHQKRCTDDLQK